MSKAAKYDFAGWVTKNDIKCTDGVIIRQNAFKDNDGERVPLVWNHNYNSPENVLGSVVLHNQPGGVYGYGYFNDTDSAKHTKELIKHGDLASMSIGARKVKRNGENVIHGRIYEVSLVLAGANEGAKIEEIFHSEDGNSEFKITDLSTGTLIHAYDDILHEDAAPEPDKKDEGDKGKDMENEEKTIGEVIDTMTDEQKDAMYALIGSIVEEDEEGDEPVKQNVFSKGANYDPNEELRHGLTASLKVAMSAGATLKQAMEQDETLKHGVNSIEMLFPEAYNSTNGNTPILYKDPNTAYAKILAGMTKSPFSRVRTLVADLTEAEARAKGYIKGAMKKEQFFSLIKRVTGPCTVYKKQKIDRDDVVDITDFDVVAFMNREMRVMLEEEIARAALIGDGRDVEDADKIDESSIRPIITDHEFFTIQKQYTDAADLMEKIILAMSEYRGSGNPDMYIDPAELAAIKLLKGTDDRFLFGDIPSTAAVASRLGLNEIVPTSFMVGKGAVIVNLRDYTLGATKGGQVTNFDDFDIDFNQYKYLIETRLSGALTLPKSAIYFSKEVITGADNTAGGVTYGTRMTTTTTTAAPTTTTTTGA